MWHKLLKKYLQIDVILFNGPKNTDSLYEIYIIRHKLWKLYLASIIRRSREIGSFGSSSQKLLKHRLKSAKVLYYKNFFKYRFVIDRQSFQRFWWLKADVFKNSSQEVQSRRRTKKSLECFLKTVMDIKLKLVANF